MNRKEFIGCVTDTLRESNKRKPVFMPRHVFHISDDEGNTKDFVVKQTEKNVIYTINDVAAMLDACEHVIEETMKRGDEINFRGFGSLRLQFRKPRKTKNFWTGDKIDVVGHYLPKFTCGNTLKLCAKFYELSEEEEKERLKEADCIAGIAAEADGE